MSLTTQNEQSCAMFKELKQRYTHAHTVRGVKPDIERSENEITNFVKIS